jgi:hypothetical protein
LYDKWELHDATQEETGVLEPPTERTGLRQN